MISGIKYRIDSDWSALIYQVDKYGETENSTEIPCKLGEKYSVLAPASGNNGRSCILIEKGPDGESILRLVETKNYRVKMIGPEDRKAVLPHFRNETNRFLKTVRDGNIFDFQFINYLGRAKLIFGDAEEDPSIAFEVVPDKMNYEDDYISLTNAIAEECSALLLEFSGATSDIFTQGTETASTLLEQFIFLRQFCYGENVQSLFAAIKRNPDRMLVHEEVLKPFGTGIPSSKFYSNPFSYSRAWTIAGTRSDGKEYGLPQQIAVTRKYDSLDTPANRFIKFALEKFDSVCTDLIGSLSADAAGRQAECLYEAKVLHERIEEIFNDSFFDDIGPLDIMPQNNQVLQKREGYSQIFRAYSMIDLALQLDWAGKDDVYEGESKNVALLYEYWLFFELYKIIKSIDGCRETDSEDNHFLRVSNNRLDISLKQGSESKQSFAIDKLGMKINLYYNRTFMPKSFSTTSYEGSYSRPFRPDYTISVFPNDYKTETAAIRDGNVSFIHFDAKYRITDLTGFIGKGNSSEDIENELAEDKNDSVTNTYKRGDLLKMHTYNDAIRRTVGSYVLYPGEYSSEDRKAEFKLYEEILPGVGAFAVKPSNLGQSSLVLRDFIEKLIDTKSRNQSRLNRIEYFAEGVIREPGMESPIELAPAVPSDRKYVLGYLRDKYYSFLKDTGKLENGGRFPFYFYAIKGNSVYSHNRDIPQIKFFRFYINDIHETDSYKIEPVLCKVLSNALIPKSELIEKLKEIGMESGDNEHKADFYYVLEVEVENSFSPVPEKSLEEVYAQNGNDAYSPHSPKVIG